MLGFCYSAPLSRLVFAIVAALLLAGSAILADVPDEGWYPIGPPGGEVTYIQADYQNPGTLYAANRIAGVFKSTDAGNHWSLVNSGLPRSYYFGPLVIDPFAPQTLYIGTQDTSTVGGRGVYRTTDGGATWQPVCPEGIGVGETVADPQRAGVIYAWGSSRYSMNSVRYTLTRTVDRGETCEEVGLPFYYISAPVYYIQLAVDSANPALLHVLVSSLGSKNYVYYRKSPETAWIESPLPDSQVTAILTSRQMPGLVLLATSHGLYRSMDSGVNWARATGLGETEVTKLVENRGTGAFYLVQNGIFVSRDLGATWTRLTAETLPDLEVLEPDPFTDQTLYAGTKQGVFKSSDGGRSWQPASNGLTTASVVGLFPHPAVSGRLYVTANPPSGSPVASCGECKLLKTEDNGGHWKSLSLSNVIAVRFSPDNPSLVYALTRTGVWTSRDAGDSWNPSTVGLPSPFPYPGDLQVDPRNHATLYLTISGPSGPPTELYRSINGGESWERVSVLPDSAHSYDQALGITSGDSPVLLVSGFYGSFRSRNGGQTWEPIEPRGNTILIAPSDARVIYIGTYRSDDAGEHWRGIWVWNRPTSVDWFDPMLIYGAGSRSRDGGVSWDYYGQSAGQINFDLSTIIADPHEPGAAYAGSSGSGAFRRVGPSALALYFPYLAEDASSFTGFAIGNLLDGTNRLDFTAFSASGDLLPLAHNPATHVLEPDQQLANLGREIFAERQAQSVKGWIAVKSEFQAGGFFLFAGDGKADGALAETASGTLLYFSRVVQGPGAFLGQNATTTIVLANPEAQTAYVTLSLFSDGGEPVSVQRTIPARGRLEESVASLFGADRSITSGYIAVVGYHVVGFEMIELPDSRAAFALNALRKISLGKAWSAQLANVPGTKTRIKLINTLWDKSIKAVLTAVGESGQPLADAVEVEIPKNGALERDVADLFKFDTSKPVVGSLTVTADSSGLVGDVVFGDLETFRLIAALPLQTEAFREALFSQVANGMGYYNGLALYNPADQPNEVRITVRNADGQMTGEKSLTMQPGSRLANLLPELIPSTAGQIRGTIRVTSSLGVVAQELFGTEEFLAAVPAWPVAR